MAKTIKIKTFEEAYKAKGLDPLALPDVSMIPAEHQKALVATYKLYIIAEVLNGGWKPNWNDSDELKYYPWMRIKADKDHPGETGLSCGGYVYDGQGSGVGSRLCFKSSELAKYAGTQFADLYAEAHLYL